MPRAVRSTRNTKKKNQLQKEKEKLQQEPTTTNIQTTTTNSTRDPSVDNYKLHFELTDLEPTKSTTPRTNEDIGQVLDQDQRGGVGDDNSQGLTLGKIESDSRVDEDRDGSGEPDQTSSNIDQPRVNTTRHERFIPRSSSPIHHKYPIDPHLSYLPQYLHQSEMQQHYSHHHDSASNGNGSMNQHQQQSPHHPQHSQLHSSQSPIHHSHQLPPLNVHHQTPSHHQPPPPLQHYYNTPQAGPSSSHSPHSHSIPLGHSSSHGGHHPSHNGHGHGHHTPHSQHTPHGSHHPHPYNSPYSAPHSGSMYGQSPHQGMYTPHQSSPYAQHQQYVHHPVPPPMNAPAPVRLGEFLHGLSRHIVPNPNQTSPSAQGYGFSDENVALFKKETQQTNSKRHTEDKSRRDWLSKRLNLMPEVVARAMVNTGNTESFNMIAKLPFPNERPVNMTTDMEIFNNHIRIMGAEFPHDGELDWYRAVFVPYDAQLYITRRPAVARCNGRIVVKQPQTLKGGRCRVFIVGYYNPAAHRWEYSTKFAVYGTRFLIRDKGASPTKGARAEPATPVSVAPASAPGTGPAATGPAPAISPVTATAHAQPVE